MFWKKVTLELQTSLLSNDKINYKNENDLIQIVENENENGIESKSENDNILKCLNAKILLMYNVHCTFIFLI